MESLFRTAAGRLVLVLGGVDLFFMGVASLANDPALTMVLVALIPMLSIALGIYIVVLTAHEHGGLLPIGLLSMMLFLGGVYVFGLESATYSGPAAGVVLVVIGALAMIAAVVSSLAPAEHRRSIESAA